MCVIAVYDKNYPKLEDLESMELMNSHGGSLAWRENGMIRYVKNIKAKEIMDIIEVQKIQLPLIIHFRIASVGSVSPELCHPFPISSEVELNLSNTSQAVLFHNGTWAEWSDYLIRVCIAKNIHAPNDKISDSRVMAWLAFHYGYNFLASVIDKSDKVVIFTPTEIMRLGSFENYQEKCQVSNNFFVRSEEKDQSYGIWGGGFGGYFGQESTQAKLSKKDKQALKKFAKKNGQRKISDKHWQERFEMNFECLSEHEKQLLDELKNEYDCTKYEIVEALQLFNYDFESACDYLRQISKIKLGRSYYD